MSTVSLMPVGKKIKNVKHTVMKVESMLSTAKNVEEAGMIINKNLILDPGSVLRVDAFSASVGEKNYPLVKLSVFPNGGRMGQLYVNLLSIDGLTWETVEEEQKDPPKPVRRIDVEFDAIKGTQVCWHSAFGNERYDIHLPEWKIVNPLALSKEELESRSFVWEYSSNKGRAVVKIDKEIHHYELDYLVKCHFKLQVDSENGLLKGKYNYMTVVLRIKKRSFSEEPWVELLEESRQTDVDHTKLVKDYLREKHGL